MKNAYLSRQVFFAFNQFAIICYLGFMAAQNDFIQQNSFVHFLLLSFLIFDAVYLLPGVLLIIMSELLKEAFEMQKELNEIL